MLITTKEIGTLQMPFSKVLDIVVSSASPKMPSASLEQESEPFTALEQKAPY